MGERNQNILKSIEDGKVPMLPFELTVATNALGSHLDKQSELGKKLGEMMRQSSETWHDNAPAEAIVDESNILAAVAEKTIRTINEADVFDYSNDDESVTLGSLVEIRYGGDGETRFFVLTGVIIEIPEEITNTEEAECVTISSPLGVALFDKQKGDKASYRVNGKTMQVEVINVRSVVA